MVLGRGRPLNLTVNNLKNSDAPRSLIPRSDHGINQASEVNEFKTKPYPGIGKALRTLSGKKIRALISL